MLTLTKNYAVKTGQPRIFNKTKLLKLIGNGLNQILQLAVYDWLMAPVNQDIPGQLLGVFYEPQSIFKLMFSLQQQRDCIFRHDILLKK